MELTTDLEKVLNEERIRMREERDEALAAFKKYKENHKEDVTVMMFQEHDESNGGYHHPTHKATMTIQKGATTLRLEGEEIKKVVFAAGGNFRR